MTSRFLSSLAEKTEDLKAEGLFKSERRIAGPQQAAIDVTENGDLMLTHMYDDTLSIDAEGLDLPQAVLGAAAAVLAVAVAATTNFFTFYLSFYSYSKV